MCRELNESKQEETGGEGDSNYKGLLIRWKLLIFRNAQNAERSSFGLFTHVIRTRNFWVSVITSVQGTEREKDENSGITLWRNGIISRKSSSRRTRRKQVALAK